MMNLIQIAHSFLSPPLLAPQEFCQALQQPDAKVFKNYLKVGIWKNLYIFIQLGDVSEPRENTYYRILCHTVV